MINNCIDINNFNKSEKTNVIFVFVGQCTHWSDMSKELYEKEIVFRNEMDRIDNWFKDKYYGYSMLEKLRKTDDAKSEELMEQNLSHSILFMFQISIFKLFKHYGVEPNLIFGCSCGEISASYCSGIFDFENACDILYNRAKLQKKTIKLSDTIDNDHNVDNFMTKFENGLLKINIGPDEFNDFYSKKYPNIEIAIYCDENSLIVGGKNKDLIELSNEITKLGIFSKIIPVPTSFHTSSQEIIKDEVMNLKLNHLKYSIPTQPKSNIPMISSVNCKFFKVLNNDENVNFNELDNNIEKIDKKMILFDNEYLYKNIRDPIKYPQTVKSLFNHIETNNLGKKVTVIEIAPHPILINHILSIIPNDGYFNHNSILLLCPLYKGKSDTTEFFSSVDKFNNFKSK
ncbi:hypothetical protein RB653_002589 [Dictyostelium firmibasis]|uniref:Malonyl-CoA:ACP transacylase (MAT) domain-containing protein n=1 Tax=Dictyostelium firmibasis TaxID=79012 RepID=A0AAN7TXI5_9MYCE